MILGFNGECLLRERELCFGTTSLNNSPSRRYPASWLAGSRSGDLLRAGIVCVTAAGQNEADAEPAATPEKTAKGAELD